LENNKGANGAPTLNLLISEEYVRGILRCPQGGTCTVGRLGELPSCSVTQDNVLFIESRVPSPPDRVRKY